MSVRPVLVAVMLLCGTLVPFSAKADHIMGGEITWRCLGGGEYIFTLKIYRDCNGSMLGIAGIQIDVANHPTLSSIPVSLVSQTELSPSCTPVAGSPAQISCASPSVGALQEFVFESVPTILTGTPPVNGWHFTWTSGYRNASITNLIDPQTKGITLRSSMYAYQGNNTNPCYDSSPAFLEPPSTILCSGTSYTYNHNAFDADLDSLVYSWAQPLDITIGNYNPPSNPSALPFQTGYSANSPTPGTGANPNNIPASLNSQTGEITFTSFTQGTFVVVVRVESYRCGIKVSEVHREIQIIVLNCAGTNSAPNVTPPFPTGYHDTVYAGDLVNFTISATDFDLLHDNITPQQVTITALGSQFGAGYTNAAAGCNNPPCATIVQPIPQTGVQSASVDFIWQTDCNHLSNTQCGSNGNTYNFTFHIKDNYCSVPGSRVVTATITVLQRPVLPAPDINCAQVLQNGDVNLTWTPVNDPFNSFQEYRVFSSYSLAGPYTLVHTTPNIAQNSFTHIGADANNGSVYYFIQTISGCAGANPPQNSDTLRTIYLQVINPGNGTAQLQWNAMINPPLVSSVPFYNIYIEYPLGTWTLHKQVSFGTNILIDTISVCSDTLNWRVEVEDVTGCVSVSNADGDWFEDVLPPVAPNLISVTVDTTNGTANLTWLPSTSQDTDGYIIYQFINGGWTVLDTLYGITNTNYPYVGSNADNENEIFGIAAFDTCWTGFPSSPNTSALGNVQQSIHLKLQKDVCDSSIKLRWNRYINWQGGVSRYLVYASENGLPFSLVSTITNGDTLYVHRNLNYNSTYCYLIRAENDVLSVHVLSNRTCIFLQQPPKPSDLYLSTVTIPYENAIQVKIMADQTVPNTSFRVERSLNQNSNYKTRVNFNSGSLPPIFLDNGFTQDESYYYRVVSLDSCRVEADTSNLGRTIRLLAVADNENLEIRLSWNDYRLWNGAVQEYRLYRSVNGVFDASPIATLPPNQLEYIDNVEVLIGTNANGEICYKIEAVENINTFGFSETSLSNIACAVIQELVFIPNAMVIGGVNDVFYPVINFARFDEYKMMIFNRWGDKIFETTEYTQGWDGRDKEKPYGTDNTYVYVITLRNGEGKFLEYRGTITVLRN
jgi:gliding motility-associated-like protein